jgi:hypothetical protein
VINNINLAKAAALLCAAMAAGCGEYVEAGRSPARVIISTLEGASGAEPDAFGNTLRSDVQTIVEVTINGNQVRVPTIFNDVGRATLRLVLRDPGVPGLAATPSTLNQVTFTRYRVVFRRNDGHNVEGVDIPYGFDSAATFTVPNDGTITVGFDLVRHSAKEEAPLRQLVASPNFVATIAEITFYGKDLAGNDVSVSGTMGITFGDFADPD